MKGKLLWKGGNFEKQKTIKTECKLSFSRRRQKKKKGSTSTGF